LEEFYSIGFDTVEVEWNERIESDGMSLLAKTIEKKQIRKILQPKKRFEFNLLSQKNFCFLSCIAAVLVFLVSVVFFYFNEQDVLDYYFVIFWWEWIISNYYNNEFAFIKKYRK
jgi:hypothetical protein